MNLTEQQQKVFKAVKTFVMDNTKSVFILKGYAGTGKTTMIKMLVPEIEQMGKCVRLMAPTGRAAKVLKDKTECEVTTIHRGIYAFDNMRVVRHDENGDLVETEHGKKSGSKDKESDSLQYRFAIRSHDADHEPAHCVYIVDEASMISSRKVYNEMLHFGTDVLLDDLMTYVKPHHGGKIIFVGDPAQLPPVGDNRSAALDEAYFENLQLGVETIELTEIFRQSGESVILKNAMMIRELLQKEQRNTLSFERKDGEVVDILAEEIADSFYEHCPTPLVGDSVIVCYTNSLVKDYNEALRRRYFPGQSGVCVNDILLVVKNIVNDKLNIEFFNGDFVRVLSVSPEKEYQKAPVWTDVAGKRKKVYVELAFRDVTLLGEDGKQTTCKIVDSLLDSPAANLNPLEIMALYINFRMRHPHLKENEEAFSETLKQDPYFNALQVKYGYAITGHKSQGGEWQTVYVDYSGRTGLNDDSLRWMYTATTRGKKQLYGVNMPSITPLSKLAVNPIKKATKIPKDAFCFAETERVDALPDTASAFQKQKFLCVKEQLAELGFYLSGVQCFQYLDKYIVETTEGTVVVNCYYNATGVYTRYLPAVDLPVAEKILQVMEKDEGMRYAVHYTPSCEVLGHLYNKMLSLCDGAGAQITNIVENRSQFFVNYYLKTSGKFASIQFYFKANGVITHAIPLSDLGTDDMKLQEIINGLG